MPPSALNGADVGDLVLAEIVPGRRLGLARAEVRERIGRPDDPSTISLMTAVASGLPLSFPPEALEQAAAATPVEELGRREDLRGIDLVTIDGEDARDFDDAVWAAPDADPKNPGGYRLVVAIADVAHYVRPGDALDDEARKRGNSVYFPDRVIPMLPEALSNNLCSLRPDEDRACLACEMTIDQDGELRRWRFTRGLMRSRARLTYTRVQAAFEGNPDEQTGPLLETVIKPLYAAFDRLLEARKKRGTIELDLAERKVVFDERGEPVGVEPRRRQASNMLIEEFMIAANVAAASLLDDARQPCLYRVHDKPDPVRLEALAQFLERLGVPWSRSGKRPGDFTKLLAGLTEPGGMRDLVSTLVLRSQAQAVYAPENIGHFGLNLKRYAHFTSPIRRYSDLVVHRALIRRLGLGEGGLPPGVDEPQLASMGDHLSRTERRAMEAERRAFERFTARFMASQVGARFRGRVTGTAGFGLFVVLDDTGAEGLVPVSTLGPEFFVLDEAHHALVGQSSGEAFGLGDAVEVTLVEADPVQGTLLFRLEEHER
ncbi:MAG TPA: ribonuclease R, partial [Geminicoccaceae bacterium]